MSEITENTFEKGLLQDISKYRVPNGYMIDSFQVELSNKQGSNFVLSSANGNEQIIALSEGYVPLAAQEYDGLLYILSVDSVSKRIELGTYKSPSGGQPSSGGQTEQNLYQALYNVRDGGIPTKANFSFSSLGITVDTIAHVDMVLQLDYDNSVNIILVSESFQPFLYNSGFEYRDNKFYSLVRSPYQLSGILNQVKLIIDNTQTLSIEYSNIGPGGQLKPGSYTYYFSYLTADFNESELAGQSNNCHVFFGQGDKIRGGDETERTGNRVQLSLTNIDTKFAYIQPYVTYRSGAESAVKQILKFASPIPINGSSLLFTHNGVEEVDDIPIEDLGIDFANIKAAKLAASTRGYLFLGGITENERLSSLLRNYAETVTLTPAIKEFADTADIYKDPENVYKFTGYFGGEPYVFGLVAKYVGGGYSPVFPIQGYDYLENNPTRVSGKETGVFRFPNSTEEQIHIDEKVRVKYVQATFTEPISDELKEVISEVFIVRAERAGTGYIGQGALLPTVAVPPGPYLQRFDGPELTYSLIYKNDPDSYKYFPVLDGLVEGWQLDALLLPDYYVNDSNNIQINPNLIYAFRSLQGSSVDPVPTYQFDKYAFYSPEAMGNGTKVASVVGAASHMVMNSIINFTVTDQIETNTSYANTVYGASTTDATGVRYEFTSMIPIIGNKTIEQADAIAEGTFATGSDFVSKMSQQLYLGDTVIVMVEENALPYVGIKFDSNLGNTAASRPAGTALRVFNANEDDFELSEAGDLLHYQNLNTLVPGAYLGTMYAAPPLESPVDYYPNRDSIPYSQISKRYSVNNIPGTAINLFGGDCFIGKVYQRMYTSGFRDPQTPDPRTSGGYERNIDLGFIFSFFAESSYNPNLRHRYFTNDSDIDLTSFYPYDKDYRAQRFPDSQIISPGYQPEIGDFAQLPNPEDIPDAKSSFYTRVFPSSVHIPNSFENGFRVFTTGWQDYPTNHGKLTRIIGYSTDLVLVFEHGIGITPIRPRVVTGQDVAGEAFLKTEGTITEAFGLISSEYGAQHSGAIKKTPHYIYGIDQQEGKIWRVGLNKQFEVLSDGIISSRIQTISDPRIGYDPKLKLVYFTSGDDNTSELTGDNFCYIYSEEHGKFISRSINTAEFYTTLSQQGMIGFRNGQGFLYGADFPLLFEAAFDPYFEVAVNPHINLTKVFDYINVVSNNVQPKSITLTVYNSDNTVNQKTEILRGTDFFTQEEKIFYRDKRWVAQIPKVTEATYKELDNWGIENRLRDKYVVMRVTYDNGDLDFETAAVHTFYRISRS